MLSIAKKRDGSPKMESLVLGPSSSNQLNDSSAFREAGSDPSWPGCPGQH